MSALDIIRRIARQAGVARGGPVAPVVHMGEFVGLMPDAPDQDRPSALEHYMNLSESELNSILRNLEIGAITLAEAQERLGLTEFMNPADRGTVTATSLPAYSPGERVTIDGTEYAVATSSGSVMLDQPLRAPETFGIRVVTTNDGLQYFEASGMYSRDGVTWSREIPAHREQTYEEIEVGEPEYPAAKRRHIQPNGTRTAPPSCHPQETAG